MLKQYAVFHHFKHHLLELPCIFRWYNPSVFAVNDNFITAVDVADDRRKPHCTSLHHNIWETLTVTWEYQAVGNGKIRAHIFLETNRNDIRIMFNFLQCLFLERIQICLGGPYQQKPDMLLFLHNFRKCSNQFVDALVPYQTANKNKNKIFRTDPQKPFKIFSLLPADSTGREKRSINTVGRTISDNFHFARTSKMMHHDKIIQPFRIGIDMCCRGISEFFYHIENFSLYTFCLHERKSGNCMQPQRNPGQSGSKHAYNSGFGCMGMYHIRFFRSTELIEFPERNQIFQRRDGSGHLKANGTDMFIMAYVFQFCSAARNSYYLYSLTGHKTMLSFQKNFQRDRYSCHTKKFWAVHV